MSGFGKNEQTNCGLGVEKKSIKRAYGRTVDSISVISICKSFQTRIHGSRVEKSTRLKNTFSNAPPPGSAVRAAGRGVTGQAPVRVTIVERKKNDNTRRSCVTGPFFRAHCAYHVNQLHRNTSQGPSSAAPVYLLPSGTHTHTPVAEQKTRADVCCTRRRRRIENNERV